jgi:methyltransferase-like protein
MSRLPPNKLAVKIFRLLSQTVFWGVKLVVKTLKNFTMTNKTTEVVIYQIKADKVADYSNLSRATDNFLGMRKGFITRRLTQDSKDKSIFLDIIEWETLEDAEGAAQAIQQDDAMKMLFSSTEKLISFGHYHNFR